MIESCAEHSRDDAGDLALAGADEEAPGLAGPVLAVTRAEWRAFLGGVRAGELD